MIVEVVKALLMNAAAVNAVAVCDETQGGGVPIDPLIQDTGLQGKGVMVYEEAKIQYAALLRAFQDKTGIWPDPKVGEGIAGVGDLTALLPKVLSLLQSLPAGTPLASLGDVVNLLGKLLPAAPSPAPAAKAGAPAKAPPPPGSELKS
ncbi:MAG TPA: hypothetical protein VJ739_18450 [Gemmataceae bacterium]|nr:hypothetical protein [Gemmataceae bacterium]